MRNTFITLIIAAGLAAFAVPAQAGFFVEPFVGYEGSGSWEGEDQNGDDLKVDVTGTQFGLRGGYSVMGFRFGAEYAQTTSEGKEDGVEHEFAPTDISLYVGYEFPILLKIWAAYAVDSKATYDIEGAEFGEFVEPTMTKIGIAYSGLPFVDIGIESINRSYDKIEVKALDGEKQDTDIKASTLVLQVALSLP